MSDVIKIIRKGVLKVYFYMYIYMYKECIFLLIFDIFEATFNKKRILNSMTCKLYNLCIIMI